MAADTPMMSQYNAIKKNLPDTILFFRLGDFYEMFNEDAKIASQALDITLTTRNKNSENPIPLCGIPYHALDQYLKKLIKDGYKVAICEQTEDPKLAQGIVKREVVKIITPGVISSPELIDCSANNYLAAVSPTLENGFIVGFLDVSTGEFRYCELTTSEQLINELMKFGAKEIVTPSLFVQQLKTLLRPVSYLRDIPVSHPQDTPLASPGDLRRRVEKQFEGAETISEEKVQLLSLVISYLGETDKEALKHVSTAAFYQHSEFLELDEATRRNLEIFQTTSGSKKNSLLAVLDQTTTPMGARLLRQWIAFPLKNRVAIECRLQAVDAFFKFSWLQQSIIKELRQLSDIERLATKISIGSVTPKDLVKLNDSLKVIPELVTLLDKSDDTQLKSFIAAFDLMESVTILLDQTLIADPPATIKQTGFIKDGYHKELDHFRGLATNAKSIIAQMEQEERTHTSISTLRIKYNNVFGYFIEVSKGKTDLVPASYIRKQTLTNAERYFTPALKAIEEEIQSAEEKIIALENTIFCDICTQLAKCTTQLKENARLIAKIDVLNAFATLAAKWNYVKPELKDAGAIDIADGRHPVIEQNLVLLRNSQQSNQFIPNSTHLDHEQNMISLITGPNMAGKSTIMRQTAHIVLMAQIGSFVPARSATIGIVDKIFTRVGASDNLSEGQSTFMVEMLETANILNCATPHSLILLDEIGRGTSTYDGLSIAWAVVEDLHNRVKAKTLFATHYHELTLLGETLDKVVNLQVLVEEKDGAIRFLRKLAPGAIRKSYGIQVAKLAGVPESVISRAYTILNDLESAPSKGRHEENHAASREDSPTAKLLSFPVQHTLFAEPDMGNTALSNQPNGAQLDYQEELSKIERFPIDRKTPLDALNFIARLQIRLKTLAHQGFLRS